MNRDSVDWKGYWPASPTPFAADGSLDLDTLRLLVEHYLELGVHGMMMLGTTGEWFSQSHEERCLVAKTALDQVAGRVPVVIGVTAFTAKEAIELGKAAMDAGAAGIESTPPPYVKTYEHETIAYYEEIAEVLPDAPILVYNWVHGTAVEIGPELAQRIVEIDTVAAFKDSTPNFEQFKATSAAIVDKVRVFGPFMGQAGFEHLLTHGGDGFIDGGTIWGKAGPQFWESYWRGDLDACRAHAERIDRLFPKLWTPGGWGGLYGGYQSQLKAIMKMQGQPGGEPRRPRLPVTDPESLAAIRAILREENLLPEEG